MNRSAHALRAIGALMVLLALMLMTPKLLAQSSHAAVAARGEVSVVIVENIQAGHAELFFDGPPPVVAGSGKQDTAVF